MGYAGDHRLLYRICVQDIQGRGWSRAMDRYFQEHAAPRAVRNRTRIVADAIKSLVCERKRPVHVVSVGSGPACEVEWALQELPRPAGELLHVTLLDMDPRALDDGATRLGAYMRVSDQLQLRRVNLGRLPRFPFEQLWNRPADLLYCCGFFDYLDRQAATNMLRLFRQGIADACECIVFNFGLNNPSRAYMEWIGNWYLHYRDKQELQALAEEAGFENVVVDVEPTLVNLFLHARNEDRGCHRA
jgi:hypothetical protein